MKTDNKPKIVAAQWLLSILAFAGKVIIGVLGVVYGIFKSVYEGSAYEWWQSISEVFDKSMNVLGRYLLNDTMKINKKVNSSYQFGNDEDTVSYAMARNKMIRNDNGHLRFWEKATNLFEKEHLKKTFDRNKDYIIKTYNEIKDLKYD